MCQRLSLQILSSPGYFFDDEATPPVNSYGAHS